MKMLALFMLTSSIVVANAGQPKGQRIGGVVRPAPLYNNYPSNAQHDGYEINNPRDEGDAVDQGNNLSYNKERSIILPPGKLVRKQSRRKLDDSDSDDPPPPPPPPPPPSPSAPRSESTASESKASESTASESTASESTASESTASTKSSDSSHDDDSWSDWSHDWSSDDSHSHSHHSWDSSYWEDWWDSWWDDYSGSASASASASGSGDSASDGAGGLLDSICLSPDATALVETKGKVSIKDVTVGDKVMTAGGEYKTVFSLLHFHPDRLTSFVSVQTEMNDENPLELSPLHMLFLAGTPNPIPAKDVKIGDVVQTLYHGPQEVTNINIVTRNGFYNPVTTDGTMVVDGIVTSTYTSLDGGSHLEIAGRKVISFHSLLVMIASPFRAFCTTVSLDLCTRHQDGVVRSMIEFREFFWQQNSVRQLFLFFALVPFFGLAHIILTSAGTLGIVVFIGTMIWYSVSSRQSSSACQKKHSIQKKSN